MVGYTGGSGRDPTYENIQDFAEGIRVEFDEAQVSFEDLLEAYLAFCTPAPRATHLCTRLVVDETSL